MNQYREYQEDFNRRQRSTDSGKVIQKTIVKIEIIFVVAILAAFAFGFYFGTKEATQKCAAEVANIK